MNHKIAGWEKTFFITMFFIGLELLDLCKMLWWHFIRFVLVMSIIWGGVEYLAAPSNTLTILDVFLNVEKIQLNLTLAIFSVAAALVFLIRLFDKVTYLQKKSKLKGKSELNPFVEFRAWNARK